MMKNKHLISASLLASNFLELGSEVAKSIQGGTDWIHADVMDGSFVPEITFGAPVIEQIKKVCSVPLDVHLMIVKPENHFERFIQAGADILTIHCENNANVHLTLLEIRKAGARPAVAFNPGTPVEMVEPLLPFVDMVLAMTVNPGKGGQAFIPETLEKVSRIRQIADQRGYNLNIQVDGGINSKTIGACCQAGANVFVAGTAIFEHPQGIAAGVDTLRNSCK